MKSVIILFAYQCIHFNIHEAKATSQSVAVQDYYWRNYDGLVPTDALQGGTDEEENLTYVGQFSVSAAYSTRRSSVHTIPGTIRAGVKFAIGPYANRAVRGTIINNLKILCAADSHKYRWAPVTAEYPPGCQAVVGGNEDAIPLYIGRVDLDNQRVIGKIFSNPKNHNPNLIVVNGTREATYENYEILTYCGNTSFQ